MDQSPSYTFPASAALIIPIDGVLSFQKFTIFAPQRNPPGLTVIYCGNKAYI
jgi:hypothetical protein